MNRGSVKTTIFYHPGLRKWCVKTAIPPSHGRAGTAKSAAKRLTTELRFSAGCEFNSIAMAYIFEEDKLSAVKQILTDFFGHDWVEMPKLDLPPPTPAQPDRTALWQRFARLVGLTNGQVSTPLPLDEATKVWRRAMVSNHPDRGGDAAVAAEINAAWQEVRETL